MSELIDVGNVFETHSAFDCSIAKSDTDVIVGQIMNRNFIQYILCFLLYEFI